MTLSLAAKQTDASKEYKLCTLSVLSLTGKSDMQNLGYYYQYKIDVYNNSSKYFAI